ncbi:MAG: tyrosine-type recombinase/integrase [Pseudomonadota bacterium]
MNDDLLIAQRSDQRKATWYLLKLGNKWVRRSLGTGDLKAARAKAYEAARVWHEDPNGDWMAAIGSTKHHLGFKQVAEEWLATQTKDRHYKADVIRKFLIPFFHEENGVTNMAAVDDALIAEYKVWRLNFWKRQASGDMPANVKTKAKQSEHYGTPSPNTLNRENPTLRQILGYAAKKGCFSGRPVPTVAIEAAKPNPRPALLGGDFDKLAAEAEKWLAEAADEAQRYRRQLLADWIWVARHTGIRLPHEAEKITWGDVRLDTKLLHIARDTKTGRREVPLSEKAASRLMRMRERRLAYAQEARQNFSESEQVFIQVDGTAFGDLGGLFNELVERCSFPTRSDGSAYSPYCLRHTFATFALAEGMTGDHVAEIMGSSVTMLNKHYKHGTIEQTRRYLDERGLLPSAQQSQRRDHPTSLLVAPQAHLPDGDWRQKELVLTRDGKGLTISSASGNASESPLEGSSRAQRNT